MADNQDILKGIVQLIIIVAFTIFFFSYFSKKTAKFIKLFLLVILCVWISMAIVVGLEYYFFRDASVLFSFGGFIDLMKESLPMSLIFGGLVFFIKYKKLRKNMK